MPTRTDIEPLSKQLTIVVGLTVVGFMAFGLALSFYRNVLFDQTLADLENRNKAIALQIAHDYGDLEYYQSDQYRDKFAKENLNKVNPGEHVLIFTQPTPPLGASATGALVNEQQAAAYSELIDQMPVIEQWNLYLFHPDKLEELKKVL